MTPDFLKSAARRLGRPTAVVFIALAACIIAVAETRENHMWHRDKMDDIEEMHESEFYHPLLFISESYENYGKAVQMMHEDPATSFWLIMKGDNLYAPVAINHYLYPGHHIRMAQETQMDVIRYWLYGIEMQIRSVEPQNYEKAIEASYYYARFPDDDANRN